MQDNDPKYTCILSQRYIKSNEEQDILQLFSWLVQSVDTHLFELVWDKLDWKLIATQRISAANLS